MASVSALARPPLPLQRPPRMPGMSGQQSSKKRPPALGPAAACESSAADEPKSFSMATPKGGNGTSKHFIGTPTAVGILNAFLDFDDTALDDEAPPLDFDDAMAALERRGTVGLGEDCCTQGCANAEIDECDSSGSTRCSVPDAIERFGLDAASDSEDDGEDNESEYEDDFESESESDYSEGEEEAVGLNREAAFAANCKLTPGQSRSQSRGRRARSSSRAKRASSRPVGEERRTRCHSLPRGPRV